jgi:NTE family protein
MNSLGSRLPSFRRKIGEDDELLLIDEPVREQINPWLEKAAAPARPDAPSAGATKSASGSRVADLSGPASLLELINQSFEVMQTSLSQYKIAGYPPDILINVPKRVCRFFEFYKAPELIMLGRQIARDSLDSYEKEH